MWIDSQRQKLFIVGPAVLWSAVFLAIYGPLVGKGFLLDDFAWIRLSRFDPAHPLQLLLSAPTGFYRPVVSASFGISVGIFGLSPLGYGITNLLLVFGAAVGVGLLGRSLGLAPLTSVGAAALWGFNPHGINMALLWISGRTSLLVTIFGSFAAVAALRGHRIICGALLFLALLSKEEAVLLPAAIAASLYGPPRGSRGYQRWILPIMIPPLMYVGLRWYSGALLRSSAPDYYRYRLDVWTLVHNGIQYADRAGTFALAMIVIAALILARWKPAGVKYRAAYSFAAIWVALSFAPTIGLPVRSSLYVCLPSVGVALVAAAFIEELMRATTSDARRRYLMAVFLAVPVLLGPVYYLRAQRWVEPARLSTQVIRALEDVSCLPTPPNFFLLTDDRKARANLANAFGGLLDDAIQLATNRALAWRVYPPLPGVPEQSLDSTGEATLTIEIRDGRVQEVKHSCR